MTGPSASRARAYPVKGTLAVDCLCLIRDSAQAILLRSTRMQLLTSFEAWTGQRPSVSIEQPDLQVNLYLYHD